MQTTRTAYLFGAFLGLTGVALGALGAHALKDQLTPEQLNSWGTATRFQMYHALALLVLGWLSHQYRSRLLGWVGIGWTLGTLCFSGSIYLLLLTELPIALVTPLGGLMLLAAWAILCVWAWQLKPEAHD